MQRRTFLATTGIAATTVLAGCAGDDNGNGTANGDEDDDAAVENDENGEEENGSENGENGDGEVEGAVVESGQPHSFDGPGAEVTDEFELDEGILTVDFSHDGESNFIVEMVALEGEQWDDEFLVNVIGDTEGSSVMSINGGTYQIDVDADGGWSLDLDQPEVSADELVEPPIEESGRGSTWIGPFSAEGVHEVHGTHDGESNFIVEGHDAEGNWELMINEIGEYEGSGTFRASGEAFWVNIEADGDWTIDIE
jgi:hypothetical protein